MSVYSIVAKYNYNALVEFRNIHYYEFFNYVPTTTELQEAVDAIDTAYKSRLQTFFADDVTFTGYVVRRLDVGGLPGSDFTATAGNWSGTNTNDPLPTQVAALVTWKAQTTYPRSTRSFIGGLTEANNGTDGKIQSGLITALENFASDMLSLAITAQVDADKVAVTISGTPPAVTDHNDVSTYSATPIWATQRRRRLGVGI